jgi:flagellar export protein FliJ
MAKSFSLQSVLSIRERAVELLEMQLAGLLAEERELKMRVEQLQRIEHGMFVDLARQQLGVLDLPFIEQVRWQLLNLQKQIRDHTRRLLDVEAQIEAKRKEIIRAEQAKETLEKLKEHEMEAWAAEIARREAVERDDQYIARAYHMNRE